MCTERVRVSSRPALPCIIEWTSSSLHGLGATYVPYIYTGGLPLVIWLRLLLLMYRSKWDGTTVRVVESDPGQRCIFTGSDGRVWLHDGTIMQWTSAATSTQSHTTQVQVQMALTVDNFADVHAVCPLGGLTQMVQHWCPVAAKSSQLGGYWSWVRARPWGQVYENDSILAGEWTDVYMEGTKRSTRAPHH